MISLGNTPAQDSLLGYSSYRFRTFFNVKRRFYLFFLLPIGHDKLIRRLPYLTICLVAINILCFIITYPIELMQRRNIETLYEEELYPLESEFYARYIQEHPEGIQSPDFYEKFHEAIKSGEIVDTASVAYQQWHDANERFIAAKESRPFYRFGFKPKRFSLQNLITAMFLHAGIMHLLFNMLFLWLVGVNIEDYWGRPLFASLFIVGGIFATLFFTLFNRISNIPLIGASGAISALMGAFAIRFYRTKIRIFWFLWIFIRPFWGTFYVFAWIALGFWFLEQLFYALVFTGSDTGVAFYAHIGGFLFGLAAGFGMKYLKVEEKYLAERIEKQIEAVDLHPKMQDAFLKRDAGDTDAAIRLLREVLNEDPENEDARFELIRCLIAAGKQQEAATEYEVVIASLYERGQKNEVFATFLEAYEKQLERFFSAKMQFKLASYLSSIKEYKKAVELFSLIARCHPDDRLAPIGLLKAGIIFIDHLDNAVLGKGALEFLVMQYPRHHSVLEAKSLLGKHADDKP
jgi:membrane associated rhomboid family serine protease